MMKHNKRVTALFLAEIGRISAASQNQIPPFHAAGARSFRPGTAASNSRV